MHGTTTQNREIFLTIPAIGKHDMIENFIESCLGISKYEELWKLKLMFICSVKSVKHDAEGIIEFIEESILPNFHFSGFLIFAVKLESL